MSKRKVKNEEIKVRDWGKVTLQFKSGKGAHRDRTTYTRKPKHRKDYE